MINSPVPIPRSIHHKIIRILTNKTYETQILLINYIDKNDYFINFQIIYVCFK